MYFHCFQPLSLFSYSILVILYRVYSKPRHSNCFSIPVYQNVTSKLSRLFQRAPPPQTNESTTVQWYPRIIISYRLTCLLLKLSKLESILDLRIRHVFKEGGGGGFLVSFCFFLTVIVKHTSALTELHKEN